jgi:periplasmic protein TonB
MRWKVQGLTLAVVLAATAGSASAQDVVSSEDSSPSETRPPTAVASPDHWAVPPLPTFYPRRALERDVNGRVVLNCGHLDDGRLTDCRIVEETPADYGFGPAALAAAEDARLAPEVVAQAPSNERLTFPVQFRLAR